jgi:hypothetical protein
VRWIIIDYNKGLLELQSCPLELELKFTPNIYKRTHVCVYVYLYLYTGCLCICVFVFVYRMFIKLTRNLCYVFEDLRLCMNIRDIVMSNG